MSAVKDSSHRVEKYDVVNDITLAYTGINIGQLVLSDLKVATKMPKRLFKGKDV